MYRQIFANRWIALAFVVLTAASAASLVGTEETDGALDRAAQQLDQQNAEFEQARAKLSGTPGNASSEEAEQMQFTAEEELIDKTDGMDVSGLDPEPEPAEIFDPLPDHMPEPELVEPEHRSMIVFDGAG